jgi:hypothetical protein
MGMKLASGGASNSFQNTFGNNFSVTEDNNTELVQEIDYTSVDYYFE